MDRYYFIALSPGEAATMWLATALNNLPATIALHAFIQGGDAANFALTKKAFVELADSRLAQRCGLIGGNTQAAWDALDRDALQGIRPMVAKLCRHPTMTAEARCARAAEDAKNVKSIKLVSNFIARDRWGAAEVKWSNRLKALFSSDNEKTMQRVAAVWARLTLEALDAFAFEALLLRLQAMGEKAPFNTIKIFRYEDYTSQPTVFCDLVEHLTAGTITAEQALQVFTTPAINKHRKSKETDPAKVYASWEVEVREVFNTILCVTGLKRFFEEKCDYHFPFVEASETAAYFVQGHMGLPSGVTVNPAAFKS